MKFEYLKQYANNISETNGFITLDFNEVSIILSNNMISFIFNTYRRKTNFHIDIDDIHCNSGFSILVEDLKKCRFKSFLKEITSYDDNNDEIKEYLIQLYFEHNQDLKSFDFVIIPLGSIGDAKAIIDFHRFFDDLISYYSIDKKCNAKF